MDLVGFAIAVAAGTLAGSLAGLVPGLHANTILPIAVAVAAGAGVQPHVAPPAPGAPLDPVLVAVGLLALAVAHNFTSVLPQTYVGVPGGEASLASLPSHRLVRDGKGRAAVRAALDATLVGCVAAIVLVLPMKWLLAEPGRLGHLPPAVGALLIAVALAWLLAQERHNGLPGIVWASAVMLLAGAAGLLAARIPLEGHTPLAPTALLPLLSGLFGGAGLLETCLTSAGLPPQEPPTPTPSVEVRQFRRAALLGAVGAAWGAIVPGLTAAGAASATPGAATRDPRAAIAGLAALGAAHQVGSVAMLATTGQARTGLAIAVGSATKVPAWTSGALPATLAALLAAVLGASVLAYAAARLLDRALAPAVARIRPRPTATVLLAALAGLAFAVTGLAGLVLFAAATAIGLVPICAGVRRVHLTAALLVPALARSLG